MIKSVPMDYLKRAIRFFGKHIFRNKLYLFTYALNYFNPFYVPKVKYHDNKETISLLKSGKSLIRLGDGEIYIMNFGSIHYQKYDDKLRDSFFQMIKEYSGDSPFILCLPKPMLLKTNLQLRKEGLLNCWLPMKVRFNLDFNQDTSYSDAFFFYYDKTLQKYLEDYLLTKRIIFVSNQVNIENFQRNTAVPSFDVVYVESPANDAYGEYETLVTSVRSLAIKSGKANCVVLLACGPASKALAFALAKDGIQAIDIGRGIEIVYTNKSLEDLIKK